MSYKYSRVCKTCRKAQVSKWKIANKNRVNEKKRARRKLFSQSHRFNKYGITTEQFNLMLKEQDNKCLICLKPSTRILQVDHNHINGKVRGLLCWKCNTFLGLLNDDIPSLKRAINHIELYK